MTQTGRFLGWILNKRSHAILNDMAQPPNLPEKCFEVQVWPCPCILWLVSSQHELNIYLCDFHLALPATFKTNDIHTCSHPIRWLDACASSRNTQFKSWNKNFYKIVRTLKERHFFFVSLFWLQHDFHFPLLDFRSVCFFRSFVRSSVCLAFCAVFGLGCFETSLDQSGSGPTQPSMDAHMWYLLAISYIIRTNCAAWMESRSTSIQSVWATMDI